MTIRSVSFLSTAAALALFGGFHLEVASGRALDSGVPNDARLQTPTSMAREDVNRASKGNREEASTNASEGRTIVFQHPDLRSTTVAIRLWETAKAGNRGRVARDDKPARRLKPTVACEGVVSVLTEVAKHLGAGRCVT